MKLKNIIGLVLLIVSSYALAGDNVAREDLTPPAPEEALTVSQIPPITTLGKPITTQPQSPVGAPRAENTAELFTPPDQIVMGQ